MKIAQKHQLEYPWNLLAAAFGEQFPESCRNKQAVTRALEFIFYTDMSTRNKNILELRYRDNRSLRHIAERYNTMPAHIENIISRELEKMQFPSRAAYLLHGCTDGIEEAEQRKEAEAARAAKEKADAEQRENEKKAQAEVLMHRAAGMYKNSILSIANPYERLDAIFARGGAEPLEKSALPRSLQKALRNSPDNIIYVYQLCFLTYLDVMFIDNIGTDALSIVESELKRLDLALDNGLLSNPRAKQQYLRYAKAQQQKTAIFPDSNTQE